MSSESTMDSNLIQGLLPAGWTFTTPEDEGYTKPLLSDRDDNLSEINVSKSNYAPIQFDNTMSEPSILGSGSEPDLLRYSIAGTPVLAIVGDWELGSINPTGDPVALDNSLNDVVGPANDRLSLAVLNEKYNPFVAQPIDALGQPLVGRFSTPGQVYEGKAFIPIKQVMQGMVTQLGEQGSVLQPLIDALNDVAAIQTPAHQFNNVSGPGNAVLFYGGPTIGHGSLDKVVSALGARHMRIIRQMVHFDSAGQGGSLTGIVSDGVGGSTHSGGYSLGYRENSEISIKSDWPSNYGRLDDDNVNYNAHLFAIDYQKGTHETIPDNVLAAYKKNADMWDCCAGMVVPFTHAEPDPDHQDYEFNPLEVSDQKSARNVAASLAQMNRQNFLSAHGAFYCSEGQYSVANLGPQEDENGGTLLKKSKFGATKFGRLIEEFQRAPEYQGMSVDDCRKHPEVGWRYLAQLAESGGGISAEQLESLDLTDRIGVFLEWIPEEIPGWQKFRPLNSEALIARPMTVVTLAWGLLRRYVPRELVAQIIAKDVLRAYSAGNADVKRAAIALCDGHTLDSPAGKLALAGVAMKAATGLLLGLMNANEFRDKVLEKAGFEQITNDDDKNKVLLEYAEFVKILKHADHTTQEDLDDAVREADNRFGKLLVERSHFNPATGERIPKIKHLMRYAAPSSIGMWAQQPYLAETSCLRYVTTAMHVAQARVDEFS